MLDALNTFSHGKNNQGVAAFEAKAPQLFWFDRATNTQVLEDFPDAVDLKATLLASVNQQHPLSTDAALGRSIGVALGAWLRSFHS